MNRRRFLGTSLGAAAAALLPNWGCSSLLGSSSGSDRDLRNIVLIMADDLGYADIGCYGNQTVRTPNIDALAAAGMKFTDYHSNGAVCSPTRAALLTGRYQQRCGIDAVVTANGPARETGMPPGEVTFAELLKKAGYSTGIIGKWHVGYRVVFNPTNQGFDEFRGYVSGNVDYHSHIDQAGIDDWWKGAEKVPEEGYVTDLLGNHAIDFIKRHKDRPFCLYLPHEAPHYPYQGRQDPPERLPGGRRGKKTSNEDIPGTYKEMVEVMDQNIGRVLETLKSLDLYRKTFIFFCSDNGANQRGDNGPLNGFKGSLWEGGHRVPAIACWPGKIKPGTVTNQTAIGMDLFATMLSVVGAKLPGDLKLDGVDLLPMLTNGDKLASRTLFWQFKNSKAARKGPWKLLVQNGKAALYNLDSDLGEKANLMQAEPRIARQLQAELAAWEKDVGISNS